MFLFKKKKKNDIDKKNLSEENDDELLENGIDTIVTNDDSIEFEVIDAVKETSKENLVEVTDPTTLLMLKDVVSKLPKTLLDIAAKNNFSLKLPKNSQTLLRSSIDPDKLQAVKGSTTAVRGFVTKSKKISEHAEFTKVDVKQLSKSKHLVKGISGVMNIGSLVVGQYYMSEITKSIGVINAELGSISSFQQIDFKAELKTLVGNVQELISSNSEILLNEDLRSRELEQINRFRNSNLKLLNQVNLLIEESMSKKDNIDNFKVYEKEVHKLDTYLKYQSILFSTLSEISKSTYTLSLGSVSLDKSYLQYNKQLEETNKLNNLLLPWHQHIENKLKIDLNTNRRQKQGVAGLLSKPLSLIDKKWEFEMIDESFKTMTSEQKQEINLKKQLPSDNFNEEVSLISIEGKYYYLKK